MQSLHKFTSIRFRFGSVWLGPKRHISTRSAASVAHKRRVHPCALPHTGGYCFCFSSSYAGALSFCCTVDGRKSLESLHATALISHMGDSCKRDECLVLSSTLPPSVTCHRSGRRAARRTRKVLGSLEETHAE